jgi:hypothetical protein
MMIVRGRSRLIVTDSLTRCIETLIGTAGDLFEDRVPTRARLGERAHEGSLRRRRSDLRGATRRRPDERLAYGGGGLVSPDDVSTARPADPRHGRQPARPLDAGDRVGWLTRACRRGEDRRSDGRGDKRRDEGLLHCVRLVMALSAGTSPFLRMRGPRTGEPPSHPPIRTPPCDLDESQRVPRLG